MCGLCADEFGPLALTNLRWFSLSVSLIMMMMKMMMVHSALVLPFREPLPRARRIIADEARKAAAAAQQQAASSSARNRLLLRELHSARGQLKAQQARGRLHLASRDCASPPEIAHRLPRLHLASRSSGLHVLPAVSVESWDSSAAYAPRAARSVR